MRHWVTDHCHLEESRWCISVPLTTWSTLCDKNGWLVLALGDRKGACHGVKLCGRDLGMSDLDGSPWPMVTPLDTLIPSGFLNPLPALPRSRSAASTRGTLKSWKIEMRLTLFAGWKYHRVQTPGRFGSAQPMPQLIMPARNHLGFGFFWCNQEIFLSTTKSLFSW